ncbi:hypothetical protein A3I51_00980 [Candidatus Gottesmanbacteria bacterium RIFCSPLOWO2_02_FULL_38_8]|nr:MAG: hypothetical protein A3I51_00980 [Candidatus Gottesmanbacteria bacterium RIFCSPLOWO2_02_FULL_38_8]
MCLARNLKEVFFLISRKQSLYIYLSQFFSAVAFAIRFFPFLLILELFMLVIILLKNKKNLPHFFIASFFIPLIYLVSHISFFIYHPQLSLFLRHKIWMLSWFRGTPVLPGNLLRNIITGRLYDTRGLLTANKEWSPLQPIIFLLALLPLRLSFNLFILYLITFIYFLYVLLLTDGVAKFIMPVFPFLAVLAIKNISIIYSIIRIWIVLKLKPLRIK